MRIKYTDRFRDRLGRAPRPIQTAFYKRVRLLSQDIRHPSLRAKKYDEVQDLWQARVNRDWRFFFVIKGNTYVLIHIGPHPK
jgi:plasmid maintenance system killer protein